MFMFFLKLIFGFVMCGCAAYALVVIVFGAWVALWEVLCACARWIGCVVYLLRQPLAFHAMQAERDQARASFEAALRISEHRAEAARRMAETVVHR